MSDLIQFNQMNLPVLTVRNTVVFPGMSLPIFVGRKHSIDAIKHARENQNLVLILAQKDQSEEKPKENTIYPMGTLCRVVSFNGDDKEGYQLIVTGLHRFFVHHYIPGEFLKARGQVINDVNGTDTVRAKALLNSLKEMAREFVKLVASENEQIYDAINRIEDLGLLSNLCAAYTQIKIADKQMILETVRVEDRAEKILDLMKKEKEVIELQGAIHNKLTKKLSRDQREHLLREQMKAIQEELGEESGKTSEHLRSRIDAAGMPKEVRDEVEKELVRFESMSKSSSEYNFMQTYLEIVADLPWNKTTEDRLDIKHAQDILHEDHYGLEKIKKRILQHLAVAKLKNDLTGSILCFLGPPGVGKTSLGKSIARALGRKFIRISLGGTRDEAEIRGHRRTYIGSMPGRIIQELRKAKVKNPVIMLDEIDKISSSFHGDPAAALLEVLDPEQNKTFMDHYVDLPFDLSKVMFIATANRLDTIPGPLLDRMEVISLSTYTLREKIEIAKKYIIPRQITDNGLVAEDLQLTDEILEYLCEGYTRESGLREFGRVIANICRAVAEKKAIQNSLQPLHVKVDRNFIQENLGPRKYLPENKIREAKPGLVTGLAWTPFGGEILFVEASSMQGNGSLKLTGQLGDVMKESAQIAFSIVKSLVKKEYYRFDRHDIHIHVPAGAIPKDGPSAGVTMVSTLYSLITNKAVPLDLAMTGEVSLQGQVLPVGGIKEKVLAAHRAEITRLVLPKENEKDLYEVPKEVLEKIHFSFVSNVEELFDVVFGDPQHYTEIAV